MPRRKTVKLNLSVVNPLIKQVFRSNVVFCEKMERAHNWVTDWNRKDKDGKPKPKNPPSPEEAAKMCILLETTPEVILLNKGTTEAETAELQADIALVRDLIDQHGAKKAPTETSECDSISPAKQALLDAIDGLTDEQCEKLLIVVEGAKKLL